MAALFRVAERAERPLTGGRSAASVRILMRRVCVLPIVIAQLLMGSEQRTGGRG